MTKIQIKTVDVLYPLDISLIPKGTAANKGKKLINETADLPKT